MKITRCPVCKREMGVYRTDVPVGEQRVLFHKTRGLRCPGFRKPPVIDDALPGVDDYMAQLAVAYNEENGHA